MTVLTLLIATVAMALFGLATPAHHERRFGRPVRPAWRRRMRIVAWSLVALTFVPAVVRGGWVYGPIFGVAILIFGAGGVFLALNLLPSFRERESLPSSSRSTRSTRSRRSDPGRAGRRG